MKKILLTETPASEATLLFDEHAVARHKNCFLRFHSAVKDPANPIITTTESWEGRGPYTWGSRIIWNPDKERYEFFYLTYDSGRGYCIGIVLSADGLSWTKPELYVNDYCGKPVKNMVKPGIGSIVRDPRPDCPADERYKSLAYTPTDSGGTKTGYSADGVHWREAAESPWAVPSDVIFTMWDHVRGKFVTYYKIWEVTGETPDLSSATGYKPVKLYFPTFSSSAWYQEPTDGLTEITGPSVTFHPESAATMENVKIKLKHGGYVNDGGGGSLTGAWVSKRVVCWAESDDWRQWRGERIVMAADALDRPDANIQIMTVTRFGNYYIGLLCMHDSRGYFEQQLAYSHDGLNWRRPWRGNFLGLGLDNAFDSAMVDNPADPVVTDTQMLFYYGGNNLCHHQSVDDPWISAIGRAVLRRDGFASWETVPGETGVVETQLFEAAGDALMVNADAGGGKLAAELLDESGRVIEGFETENCAAITEDTARFRKCSAALNWKNRSFSGLTGKKITIRFILNDAKLFSFSIV